MKRSNRINAGIHTRCNKGKETELNLSNSNKLLDESQSIAKIGSWKIDLTTHDLTWSSGHYQILICKNYLLINF
jgi:hypothetical protein